MAISCPHCGRTLPSGRALTSRQADILRFIETQIASSGAAPTFQEIAMAFSFKSLATVHEHLQNIERKGYIRRRFNEQQAITVLVPIGALKARDAAASEVGR